MIEEWKHIPNYERLYMISNLGRVKSLPKKIKNKNNSFRYSKEKILSPFIRAEYLSIHLCKPHESYRYKNFTIHSLVLLAFSGNRGNKNVINHKDGNKLNNRVDNLEYCTQSYNKKQDFINGRQSLSGEKNTQSKLTSENVLEIRVLRKSGLKYSELANKFNLSISGISNIFNGHTWTHI
jgi:hypothetical protein